MAAYGTGTSRNMADYTKEKKAVLVDLRSDTLTKPTDSMRFAMSNAEVGDDVYAEDPTVKVLEEKAARLLGKEAAIFVTSGTMGNLIAIMNHCDTRGSEAYCGSESHIFLHEQGSAAQIAGVTLCTLENKADGTFDVEKLEASIRKDRLHEPVSKLVVIENTINGKVVPMKWIQDVKAVADKYNLKMHMDGARLWNAVVSSKMSASELTAPFDSVSFCLSKGLGAPVGSLLCGTKSFISNARRARKALGGGMRQVGVLAAAGLIALDEVVPLLHKDHQKTAKFSTIFQNCDLFTVESVATNMIFLKINRRITTPIEFLRRLEAVEDDDKQEERFVVRGLAPTHDCVRFVFYHQISEKMLEGAMRKVQKVIKSYNL